MNAGPFEGMPVHSGERTRFYRNASLGLSLALFLRALPWSFMDAAHLETSTKMLKENNRFIRQAQITIDLGVTVLSFYLAYNLRSQVGDIQLRPFSAHFFLLYLI